MKKSRIFALPLLLALLTSLLALPASASGGGSGSAILDGMHIEAAAALLVDDDYGEVLYQQNAYEKAYPASITKVMTSMLTIEAIDRGELSADQIVTVEGDLHHGIGEGGSTADIRLGEQMTLKDLLACALIKSANEACNALAVVVAGDVDRFVALRNQRAAELGMEDTHFSNTHGYHDDNHYTTAYDITRFMKAAMEYDLFQTILTSPNYTLPPTNMSPEERIVRNTNALTSNYYILGYLYGPGTGGKTGTTSEAGNCLVETARDGDMYLISVILGAEEVKLDNGDTDYRQFRETIELLDWGFDNFQRVTLSPDDTLVAKVKVNLSTQADEVNVRPLGSITRTLPKDVDPDLVEATPNLFSEEVDAPVEAGQVLGVLVLSYDGTEYGKLDLVADTSVERSDFLYYKHQVESFFQNAGVKLILAAVLILAVIVLLRVLVFQKRRRYRSGAGVGGGRRGHYSGRRRR